MARPRRRGRLVAVLLTLAVLVGAVAVGLHPGTPAATANAATSCSGSHVLDVLASPSIADPVRDVARNWAAAGGPGQHECVRVAVTGMDDARAEVALASGASGATVWIPESTIWAQRLSSDLARTGTSRDVELHESVASSPIVVAVPVGRPGADTTVTSLTAAGAGGKAPISLPDPVTTAEGMLGLQLLRQVVGTSAQSTRVLVGLMVALGTRVIDSTEAGFARLGGASPSSFIASEQALLAADAASGRHVADVEYPSGPVPALDYPAVELGRAGTDPLVTSLAASFLRVLAGVTAQHDFATHGFRDPQGDPIAGATGTGAAVLRLLPVPASGETQDLLRMWSAATEASHSLVVIDVSGSMAESGGNGHSKISLAADAISRAVAYFPDSSIFGLWAFSSARGGGPSWIQLAALQPLAAPVGGTTQRARLLAAAHQLPGLVGGDTALYATALAAFEQVRNSYRPGMVNAVVLVTDGWNDDAGGPDLDALLGRLRSLSDPARPVPIITVAIGDRADVPALRQISAVTGGKTYVVRTPADIRDVFLDAMIERECRPVCSTGR